MPSGEIEHRQEGEAQQGAQQDNLLAGQVDVAGSYPVGAEQDQPKNISSKRFFHGIPPLFACKTYDIS